MNGTAGNNRAEMMASVVGLAATYGHELSGWRRNSLFEVVRVPAGNVTIHRYSAAVGNGPERPFWAGW